MTDAIEVLELQTELLYKISDFPLSSLMVTLLETIGIKPAPGVDMPAAISDSLVKARAYRVQENMTDAVCARALSYSDSEVQSKSRSVEPPRAHGFVVFEEPMRIDEEEIYYLTWSITDDGGWLVITWTDRYKNTNRDSSTYKNELMLIRESSHDLDPAMLDKMFGPFAPAYGWVVGPGKPTNGNARHFLALWEMLNETIPLKDRDTVTEIESEHVRRSAIRRARNNGLEDPGVSVVVLRRERKEPINPGSGKPLDHRVYVQGGFTRTYWIGPKDNRRAVKRVIRSYWMGDESLPVRDRKVVSELRR